MAELKKAKLSDLVFDDKNFNRHTEFGMSLLEKSLRNNGAGRSILIDKNNRIIGGNGVVEVAGQIDMEDVIIVPSDGTKIIAVKREDIDLDSKQGREMALADNATASADLQWDTENLEQAVAEFGIEAKDWGVHLAGQFDLPDELDGLDLTPDELTKIEGDDNTLRKRVIITFSPEQEDEICALLKLDAVEKVVYRFEELPL